jgi:hypothetical protein
MLTGLYAILHQHFHYVVAIRRAVVILASYYLMSRLQFLRLSMKVLYEDSRRNNQVNWLDHYILGFYSKVVHFYEFHQKIVAVLLPPPLAFEWGRRTKDDRCGLREYAQQWRMFV